MEEKFAGIDWASEEHAVCVVDGDGMRMRERLVAHDEAGIAGLRRELVELGVLRVAIERPDGILVDRLLEAGIAVIAVHPNQLKAARERYSVARGKSDRFDAFVLAELARTDAHRLRAIRPDTRGQDHPHARRILGRACARVLWRCWQDGVPYGPSSHGNLQRLQLAPGLTQGVSRNDRETASRSPQAKLHFRRGTSYPSPPCQTPIDSPGPISSRFARRA
jgi:hypothetical protein